MTNFCARFKYKIFLSLACSFVAVSSSAYKVTAGNACLGGSQDVIADVEGSVFKNPLAKNVFCLYDSSNFILDLFSEPGEWYSHKSEEMNRYAKDACRDSGRSAYFVSEETHANALKYFLTMTYVCISNSEVNQALANSLLKSGVPESVK